MTNRKMKNEGVFCLEEKKNEVWLQNSVYTFCTSAKKIIAWHKLVKVDKMFDWLQR